MAKRKPDQQKYAEAVWRQGEPKREVERLHLLATGTPVPRRITLALDSRGLEGPEVDEACGVSEPMVDWWEEGRVVPTADEVVRLAELTHYPVEFFYEPLDETEMGHVFMCRASR